VNEKDTIISEHGAPNAYNVIYKLVKKWLYHRAKVYVVPTTTDTVFYRNLGFPATYLPHFRSILPYHKSPLDKNIALSIGRYTSVKQQLILLKIWNELVHQYEILNWRLLLVGNGELKLQFEEYIQANALENYIFLKPSRQDVEYYYQNASMFLLSSESEGFGMVLLEAISFGLPCISFDCPSGPKDIIKDNENGFLISPKDVSTFKQSILRLMLNPKLKHEMGLKSFEISKNWNDSRLLEEWREILN
jgi:glycosyltransferase involved in cell wall biosynthesis